MSTTPVSGKRPLRIAFLHPDLGIGGAERLVVDAALSLQNQGHTVHMYTSHHDSDYCFMETRDGTLSVTVLGDFLPRQILGMGYIVCAIMRSLYASAKMVAMWDEPKPDKATAGYDVVFIDQLSVSIPVFLLTNARVLFYCHHPDLLLVQPGSWLKRLYRIPFDTIEQITTGLSDSIVVNSAYTGLVFGRTFGWLDRRGVKPEVLYPSILFDKYQDNRAYDTALTQWWSTQELKDTSASFEFTFGDVTGDCEPLASLSQRCCLFVSINRYERKKCIELAINALTQAKLPFVPSETDTENRFSHAKLIVAGGWDVRVSENVEYHLELIKLALSLGLRCTEYPDMYGTVVFLRSFSESQRSVLLQRAQSIVYTPENEHFGIVPLEAMYGGRPVIACSSGGPLESVLDGKTGYLCENVPSAFAEAMSKVYRGDTQDMAEECRTHVVSKFSIDAFSKQLQRCVEDTVDDKVPDLMYVRELRKAAHVLGSTPRARVVSLFNMFFVFIGLIIYFLIKFF